MDQDLDTRIAQFKKMAEADPENELGHFSLGKACLDAGRFEEAIGPLRRAIELNPKMSRAYHLLGQSLLNADKRDQAVEAMTEGILIADQQGDRMPCDAMVAALDELGVPAPVITEERQIAAATSDAADASIEGFRCSRCAAPHGQLEKPPFKGDVGAKIHANVCTSCWQEWIGMGTKVINELGLALNTTTGQETYDQYMEEFLQLQDS